MATLKERYQEALALAKAGQYAEARAILKTIDHPKARELEANLPASKPKVAAKSGSGSMVMGVAMLIVGLVIGGSAGFLAGQQSSSTQSQTILSPDQEAQSANQLTGQNSLPETYSYSGFTIKHPTGWVNNTSGDYIGLVSSSDVLNLEDIDQLKDDSVVVNITVDYGRDPANNALKEAQEAIRFWREGFKSDTITQEPVQTSEVTAVQAGNYSGAQFSFVYEGIDIQTFYIDLRPGVVISFATNSRDHTRFTNLALDMLSTVTFDEMLAGDFSCPLDNWWEGAAGDSIVQFLDTVDVAASTSRISLSGVILTMQNVYRDFEKLESPPCIESIRDQLDDGMDNTIQAFQSFAAQSEALSTIQFGDAKTAFKAAYDGMMDKKFYGMDIRLAVPSF